LPLAQPEFDLLSFSKEGGLVEEDGMEDGKAIEQGDAGGRRNSGINTDSSKQSCMIQRLVHMRNFGKTKFRKGNTTSRQNIDMKIISYHPSSSFDSY
jgi:hypothetical protein